MLRNGGILVMHDFSYPKNRLCSWILGRYFNLMQVIGSRMYPPWRLIFYELYGLIRRTEWVARSVETLQANGFSHVEVETQTLGVSTIVSARKG
jgi:demethylmenaquinone methyltransferase/2-methoxy-6-polyprenyl-1,4-benzoquinol methylase